MIILKLGGSAITKKSGYMLEDAPAISKLAGVIARAWRAGVHDLIIVNGAGSFGHAPVIKYGIKNSVRSAKQRIGFAATHAAVVRLNSMVVEALVSAGVPAGSIPPAAIIRQNNRKITSFNEKIVLDFVKAGFVPVLFGDMVLDSKLGGSVCSGDQIVSYLGRRAARVIFASNVDGVFADGKIVPEINRRNFGKIKKHLSRSAAPDVTGGMAGKISEIMKIGKTSYVVNAKKPERVLALLLGKKAVSTKIRI